MRRSLPTGLPGLSGPRPTIGACPTARRDRPRTRCSPRSCRSATARCRSSPGGGPSRRTPDGGRCPAACSATTRTSRRPCAASSPRRSTCARSRTSSSSRCSAPRDRVPGRPAHRHRVPRARPLRRRPGGARRHHLAPRRRRCPDPAFDHVEIVGAARDRLRAKLSYTNLGFALAPREFTISTLREHYAAALGHPVSATNLQRVLARRAVLVPTGELVAPGPAGGRPAALFRFAEPDAAGDRRVRGAAARRQGEHARAALP